MTTTPRYAPIGQVADAIGIDPNRIRLAIASRELGCLWDAGRFVVEVAETGRWATRLHARTAAA